MKLLIAIVCAFVLYVWYALFFNYKVKFVDIYLMEIPEYCLDENGDGSYNSKDNNYGGFNFIESGNTIELMDSKGATMSSFIDCPELATNPYRDSLVFDCDNFCRIKSWVY